MNSWKSAKGMKDSRYRVGKVGNCLNNMDGI